MMNCEKASELSSKKEDRVLSFMEKLYLKFHSMMCSTCALFEDEIDTISKAIKHEHSTNKCSHKMSENGKEKLQEIVKNQ